jgi:hypothetical protein
MTIGPIAYWGLDALLIQPPAFLAMLTAIAAFPALGWTMCAGAWRSAWTAQRQIETLQARFDRLEASIEALSIKLDAAEDIRSARETVKADRSTTSDQAPAPLCVSPPATAFPARRSGRRGQAAIRGFESDAARVEADALAQSAAPARAPFAFPAPRVASRSTPAAAPARETTSEQPQTAAVGTDPLSRAAKRRLRRNRAKQTGAEPKAPAAVDAPVSTLGAAAPPPPRADQALASPSAFWMFWPTPAPHDDLLIETQFDVDPMIDIGRFRNADPAPARLPLRASANAAAEPVAPPIAMPTGARRPFAVKQFREAQHRAFAR